MTSSGVRELSLPIEGMSCTSCAGLVEKALREEMPGYDYRPLLSGIESVMVQLGVMPFDEAALPPEDPKTF